MSMIKPLKMSNTECTASQDHHSALNLLTRNQTCELALGAAHGSVGAHEGCVGVRSIAQQHLGPPDLATLRSQASKNTLHPSPVPSSFALLCMVVSLLPGSILSNQTLSVNLFFCTCLTVLF